MLSNLEYKSGGKHGMEMYIPFNLYIPACDPSRFAISKASSYKNKGIVTDVLLEIFDFQKFVCIILQISLLLSLVVCYYL